jgi:hypothetical protein
VCVGGGGEREKVPPAYSILTFLLYQANSFKDTSYVIQPPFRHL